MHLYFNYGDDVNVNHKRCFEGMITACRRMSTKCVKAIITFESASGAEWRSPTDPRQFLPNLFISVSEDNLNAKIKGMESYEFEKRAYPHPRSPEALKIQAQRWGVSIGRPFAEAFVLVRCIAD